MNEDAADALLKDLEEPPPYAVIVLVADDLGPLPDTIRSALPARSLHASLRARDPHGDRRARSRALPERGRIACATRGGPPRPRHPLARSRVHPTARPRCSRSPASVYTDPEFEPGAAAQRLLDGARERGAEAKVKAEEDLERLDHADARG